MRDYAEAYETTWWEDQVDHYSFLIRWKLKRLRDWWKFSVLKKPRPQPKCSLDLTGFDTFLKEIYPPHIEAMASIGNPELIWRPRCEDE